MKKEYKTPLMEEMEIKQTLSLLTTSSEADETFHDWDDENDNG